MDVHAEFYDPYLAKVATENIVASLKENMNSCSTLFETLSEDESKFRYAEGKWSLRELLGHIIDAERVFSFRAISIARGEENPLPGYDENEYAKGSNAHERSILAILEEFRAVRASTILLFESFDDAMFSYIGVMSGSRTSVNSIGRIIVGHCRHHLEVIQVRYLNA